MNSFFKVAVCLISLTSLLSCTSIKVEEYKNEKPQLKLEEYLNGTIDAYGVFQNRSGKVVKRFHCVIIAKWEKGVGILDESFTYSDGTTSKRIWTVKKINETDYEGTAADVVGSAQGKVSGNAFYWKYVLSLDVDGSKYNVDFEDWMYLMNNTIMLNRSTMSKFGFNLGELTLTFVRRSK